MSQPPLNLFYAEPDGDRWLPFDRFPRKIVRRIVRGPRRPGGQERVFLNLKAGLDRLGIAYRANDYRHARRHPDELCCVLGKRHVLNQEPWLNPLMVGPCTYDHSIDDPDLPSRLDVRRILVPGPWMRDMCRSTWGNLVHAWPVGIDTERWKPNSTASKSIDVVLYNKTLWDRARHETELLSPIRAELARRKLTYVEFVYGHYRAVDYASALQKARAMIFLCEHETQGIAYQEALSSDVPLIVWDNGGEWKDPSYYPHRVRYGPVSSVPYWDERCGVKFTTAAEFASFLDHFFTLQQRGLFAPRQYILDNLTLEKCAQAFVAHAHAAAVAERGSS
ncbi:MAG: hypothetical protein QM715_02055 [Nibricoccus sp.]